MPECQASRGDQCLYSKALDQPYPRKCLHCGETEPGKLDELLEQPACAKCEHPHHAHAFNNDAGLQHCSRCGCPQYADPRQLQEPSLLLGANEAAVFAEYRAATIALRDAELAHKAAGDRYRVALTALNAAIAPVGA